MNHKQLEKIIPLARSVDPEAAARIEALQAKLGELSAEVRSVSSAQWAVWKLVKQALDRKDGTRG